MIHVWIREVTKNCLIRCLSKIIYLKDDENVDARQDDPCNGHLRFHGDPQRLMGHGQWHHFGVLQEGLHCDGDGVAVWDTTFNLTLLENRQRLVKKSSDIAELWEKSYPYQFKVWNIFRNLV